MKILLQSLAGATALYSIYSVIILSIGIIQTRNYEPDFEAAWKNAEDLPKAVAFGKKPSSVLQMTLFSGIVLICSCMLTANEKRLNKGRSSS